MKQKIIEMFPEILINRLDIFGVYRIIKAGGK